MIQIKTEMNELTWIPHVNQYLGVWAMRENEFRGQLNLVRTSDLLRTHVDLNQQQSRDVKGGPNYQITNSGIAIIQLVGTMTKYGGSLSDLRWGTIGVRRSIRKAAKDGDVSAILLVIDSPGGSVAGTNDLAEDVAFAAKKKPLTAYIEDLGASAAYWVASQANRVVANSSALVGSIGTYMVVDDLSGLYEQHGIKTYVIKAGDHKGDGIEGTEITADQIADFQRVVNELNEGFLRGVARGRKRSIGEIRELADGRIYEASKAKKLGLIDSVESFDSALAGLRKTVKTLPENASTAFSTGGIWLEDFDKKVMDIDITDTISSATSNQEVTAKMNDPKTSDDNVLATYEDIVLYCVGSDEKFVCSQLDKKVTVEQARDNWAEEQDKRVKQLETQLQEKKGEAKKPGVDALAEEKVKTETVTDAKQEWEQAVKEKMKLGLNRQRAVSRVAKDNPELRLSLIESVN